MFTMSDLEQVGYIRRTRTNGVYSPRKNQMTYELSKMPSERRATYLEKMVCAKLNSHGIRAAHVGSGGNSHDITVYTEKYNWNIEVKSALYNTNKVGGYRYSSYKFSNIKPENFDYIIFMFVTPTGIVAKFADDMDVTDWAKSGRYVYETNKGYSIRFRNVDDDVIDLTNIDCLVRMFQRKLQVA